MSKKEDFDTAVDNAGVIRLSDVSLSFPGKPEPIIEGLSAEIQPGEFVVIIGPSGCGKTTLLRLIHGLIKPTSGSIMAGNTAVTKPSRKRGFVFQSDALMPWRRVIDNVRLPLELAGMSRVESRNKAIEILDIIGMGVTAEQYPSQLSGGMRQRINLARALVADPEVLLMDEPFAALDAQTREVLQSELLNIWSRDRKTVVFVTHQLDEAVYLADRVIVLQPHPGKVREIVPINLPRPRSLDIKRSPEFIKLVDKLWGLIKTDVLENQLN